MTYWTLGFLVGLVVVLVVATLLIGILYQARRIRRLALAASDIVGDIDTNTRSIWALRDTNAVAGQLLEGARAIEGNCASIVDAVGRTHRGTDVA
ncbi:MAG: hypothetical protein ACR2RF_33785 [Geminicoccaceae bacterium]